MPSRPSAIAAVMSRSDSSMARSLGKTATRPGGAGRSTPPGPSRGDARPGPALAGLETGVGLLDPDVLLSGTEAVLGDVVERAREAGETSPVAGRRTGGLVQPRTHVDAHRVHAVADTRPWR